MPIRNFLQSFIQRTTKHAFACVLVFSLGTLASAQKEVVIHNFVGGSDGSEPSAALVSDSAGNLYGTTVLGGGSTNCGENNNQPIGCGTVYELVPPGNGVNEWTETVIYAFQGGATDGRAPGAPLIIDASGNLYGTTVSGPEGGTIFELSPPVQSGGPWTETILYFLPINVNPNSGLARDAEGNFFGELLDMQVFELSPPPTQGGAWTYSVIWKFAKEFQGQNPVGGLILDGRGNLYGTAEYGGTGNGPNCVGSNNHCGLVFVLVRPSSGTTWTEKPVYDFTGENGDGGNPEGGVIFHGGDLYGTTAYGGDDTGDGTVFKLSPPANGGEWIETTLYQFNRVQSFRPIAGVVFDSKGNLYSDTWFGPSPENTGEVFELSPPSQQGQPWIYTDLFDSNCTTDGCYMWDSLVIEGNSLYGVSAYGGTDPNDGVVFKVTP